MLLFYITIGIKFGRGGGEELECLGEKFPPLPHSRLNYMQEQSTFYGQTSIALRAADHYTPPTLEGAACTHIYVQVHTYVCVYVRMYILFRVHTYACI